MPTPTLDPISALTAMAGAPISAGLLPYVDVSDPTQAGSGTTKKLTIAELFTAPAFTDVTTATTLEVSTLLQVTGGSAGGTHPGSLVTDAALGLTVQAATGTSYDLQVLTATGGFNIFRVPTGTTTVEFGGDVTVDVDLKATGKFGCNTKTPQAAAASGTVLTTYPGDGAFGLFSTAAVLAQWNAVHVMQAALIANGILV